MCSVAYALVKMAEFDNKYQMSAVNVLLSLLQDKQSGLRITACIGLSMLKFSSIEIESNLVTSAGREKEEEVKEYLNKCLCSLSKL